MNAEKSPISILQEHAVALNIPLPIYNIFQAGTSFKCVVSVNRIIVSGVGDNKKRAKHDAAENALRIFIPGYKIDNHNVGTVDSVNNNNKNINNDVLNAVGQLNELSFKHCKTYPEYNDVSCINSMFIVTCSLLHYQTEGKGRTKKEAKQAAATEMLNRATMEDFENFARTEKEQRRSLNGEENEAILELFKKMSSTSERKFTDEHDIDGSPQIINKEVTEKIRGIDLLQLKKTERIEDLKKAFEQLNIPFKITTIQRIPLILSLQTEPLKDVPPITFLHSGSTYEETELCLLKKAIEEISTAFI